MPRPTSDDVFIVAEGVYGKVLNYGAYASLVQYMDGGVQYEVVLENDEFWLLGDDEEEI